MNYKEDPNLNDSQESQEIHKETATLMTDESQIEFEFSFQITSNGKVVEVLNDFEVRPSGSVIDFPELEKMMEALDYRKIEIDEADLEAPDESFYPRIFISKEAINEALKLGSLSLSVQDGNVQFEKLKDFRQAKIEHSEVPEGWINLVKIIERPDGKPHRVHCYWVDGNYEIQTNFDPRPHVISSNPEDRELAQIVFERVVDQVTRRGEYSRTKDSIRSAKEFKRHLDSQVQAKVEETKIGVLDKIKKFLKMK